MNAIEMFQFLARQKGPGVMTISPGPFRVQIADSDKRAGELLSWMTERWPSLTVGEAMDTLEVALWWEMFFASQPKEVSDGPTDD